MTRQECEQIIAQKLHEIVDVYHEYHPEGKYLSLCFNADDGEAMFQFNNRNWDLPDSRGEDVDMPIYYFVIEKEKEAESNEV